MIGTILYILTTILATILASCYIYKRWALSYWNRRGLETYEPKFMNIGRQYFNSYFYFKKKGLKHGGTYLFFHPHYVPVDLELIKKILINDFDHFINRGMFEYKNEKDFMNAHLFNLENQRWKNLRNKLTPTFTSGKIKMMFQTLVDTTWGLQKVFQEYADSKTPFEAKDIMARFTTDVIGSVGFGIECNSLENPDSDFRRFGRVLMDDLDTKTVGLYLFSSLPKLLRVICQKLFRKQFYKAQSVQFDTHEFFKAIVKETVDYREKNDIHRNDFLHLLLLLKNKGRLEEGTQVSIKAEKGLVGNLTLNEVTAQCFLFFIAGYDTSSTAMTFALYELARHPDIQEKLREEIHKNLAENDGKMTYDIIMKMNYLDRVISETLRMHPPLRTLTRKCKVDFPVPDTDYVIRKDDMVMIPLEAIHYDPDLYPEPEKFDPDRFSPDKKADMHPIQVLPFGEGPRMCIGSRFAQVQAKVGLTCVLNKYRVSLNNKTKLPLDLLESFLAAGVKGGLWLNVERI